MAIEAFVLPYLGHAAGVVFWEPSRTARDPQSAGSAAERLEVYAPGPLSSGEFAELRDSFAASLGAAYERPAGRTLLLWWWAIGIVVALMLFWRGYNIGPGLAPLGFGWIAFAAVLTTLPWGARLVGHGLSRRATGRAHRLARRLSSLDVATGADPRNQERIAAVWRVARRAGSAAQHLEELENHCREQAWPAAAAFYRQRRDELGGRSEPEGGVVARLRRRRPGAPAHSCVEMRAW